MSGKTCKILRGKHSSFNLCVPPNNNNSLISKLTDHVFEINIHCLILLCRLHTETNKPNYLSIKHNAIMCHGCSTWSNIVLQNHKSIHGLCINSQLLIALSAYTQSTLIVISAFLIGSICKYKFIYFCVLYLHTLHEQG